METKQIELGGISNEPNDYQHQEGDLSYAMNCVKHNGSMRVVERGQHTGNRLKYNETLMCIHTCVSDGTQRYIVLVDKNAVQITTSSSTSNVRGEVITGNTSAEYNEDVATSETTSAVLPQIITQNGLSSGNTTGNNLNAYLPTNLTNKFIKSLYINDYDGYSILCGTPTYYSADMKIQLTYDDGTKVTYDVTIYSSGSYSTTLVHKGVGNASDKSTHGNVKSATLTYVKFYNGSDYTEMYPNSGITVNSYYSTTETTVVPPTETEVTPSAYSLCWFYPVDSEREFDDDGNYTGYYTRHTIIDVDYTIRQVKPFKNILVISTDEGIKYARYKDGGFKYLGALPKLPDFNVYTSDYCLKKVNETLSRYSFVCDLSPYNAPASGIGWQGIFEQEVEDIPDGIKSTVVNAVYNSVFAFVNEARKSSHDDGKICFDVMIRFAYRLYDGTYVKVSRPYYVPMTNPSCMGVFLAWEGETVITDDNTYYFHPAIEMPEAFVKYSCSSFTYDSEWDGIIDKLCVFCSPEIVEFSDSSSSIKSMLPIEDGDATFTIDENDKGLDELRVYNFHRDFLVDTNNKKKISSVVNGCIDYDDKQAFTNGALYDIQSSVGSQTTVNPHICNVEFKRVDGKTKEDVVSSMSTFYLVDEVDMSDVSKGLDKCMGMHEDGTPKNFIDTPSGTQIDTSTITNDDIITNLLFQYNNRITVVTDKQKYKAPEELENFVCALGDTTSEVEVTQAFVRIEETDGEKFVAVSVDNNTHDFNSIIPYFFYPSENAKELIVDTATTRYTIPMKRAVGVTGSYAFSSDWDNLLTASTETPATIEEDNWYSQPNKLIQSEVDNPFALLNSQAVQLGCKNIIQFASNSMPISTGQFGEYPVIAFTDQGTFAIGVSDEGKFVTVKPLSEDVCINANSVVNAETSILFVTKRGLMELTGGQTNCLTETLNGHNYLDLLKHLETVKDIAGVIDGDESTLGEHINQWFASACILYDYKRELLYCYQPCADSKEPNVGLVFDIQSKEWGMYENRLMYNTNSYTDALCCGFASGIHINTKYTNDYTVVNMSETEDTTLTDSTGVTAGTDKETNTYNLLMITRPLTLGFDDINKTIEDILVKGVFDKNEVQVVIWASNDLKHFYVIGSSTSERWRNYSGTPYKYYRIGIIGKMQESDSINCINVAFTPRLNNKIR